MFFFIFRKIGSLLDEGRNSAEQLVWYLSPELLQCFVAMVARQILSFNNHLGGFCNDRDFELQQGCMNYSFSYNHGSVENGYI